MPCLEGIEQSTRTIGKSAGRHVTAEQVLVDTNCNPRSCASLR